MVLTCCLLSYNLLGLRYRGAHWYINIYMLLKCACVLDFLKLVGMRTYPRVCGYPRIAGTGIIFYPLWVAGAGADFSTRVRVYEVDIRADFTRWHLYIRVVNRVWTSKILSQETILSNAKCVILIYMSHLSLSHSFLICVKTWSLNKTWSLDFSPSLFHKYTVTSAKHNK